MTIIHSACPGCKSREINFALTAIDHTLSHEEFEIWQCNNCTLRFTRAIPDKDAISAYYRSENYISHSNTAKGFINSIYHTVRKITLVTKKKLIEKYTGTGTGIILDIGCGTGAFLHTMQQAGWGITGLEPDEAAKIKAKQLYGLTLQNAETLFKMPSETYDAITMWHVLEHVHDLHKDLDQVKKLLKPKGFLFIAVPNYTCYDQKIYQEYWAAFDVPRHLYHFSPKAMMYLLQLHDLKIKSMKRMWFDSFYVSMLSEKYRSGRNNILSAFWNGFVSNCKAIMDKRKCSSIIYVIEK